MTHPNDRLADLGIELPEPAKPAASYVGYRIAGDLVIVSGQLPLEGGKLTLTGKLGDGVSVEDAQAAAKVCAINLIAQVRAACDGDLGRVKAVIRLGAFVASAPGFTDQHVVTNGASDLIAQVFGDEVGAHARAAVGVAALPLDAAVEVDGIFQIG